MTSKPTILTCEYFQPELAAVLAEKAFAGIKAATFTADCDHPRQSAEICAAAAQRGGCLVLGGGCLRQIGAGKQARGHEASFYSPAAPEAGGDAERELLCAEGQRCQVLELAQCFALFAPPALLAAYVAEGAHLFTPGMLANWAAFCEHAGFSAETARDFFAESTTKLVLLDTAIDPQATARLADLSQQLGLPAERVPVGLDYLRLTLHQRLAAWQLADSKEKDRQLADYAMVNDLLSQITALTDEVTVIERVLELFSMFCAPTQVFYLPLHHGEPGELHASQPIAAKEDMLQRLSALSTPYLLDDDQNGFCIDISRGGQRLGSLAVQGIAFPQYRPHYLNLALSVAPVIALAITNARTYQQRLEAEARVKQLNAELEDRLVAVNALNQELEAFTYSVSHDLRAPLRSLDGFSNILARDYPDQLDERGQHLLQRLRANAQHMGQLIDDLLRLSRLTRTVPDKQPVNLSDIVRELAADLSQTAPERQVQFVIQAQAEAECDASLLKIVLENLLGNAWKYTGKQVAAVLEFGTQEQDGETVFCLRDNGDGFDMAYADKLFAPFQRLHTEAEFPGTGIGLATVQRIILRHGGRIWAEGTPGEGACFYFTL